MKRGTTGEILKIAPVFLPPAFIPLLAVCPGVETTAPWRIFVCVCTRVCTSTVVCALVRWEFLLHHPVNWWKKRTISDRPIVAVGILKLQRTASEKSIGCKCGTDLVSGEEQTRETLQG